jgi:hypothetical protein
MDTNEPQTQQLPTPRPIRVAVVISSLLAAVVVFVGIGILTGHLKVNTQDTVAVTVAKQDCKQPGKNVGDICASASREHGLTVTRTYVTLKFDDGTPYAYLQDTSVQLNYNDDATIDSLCRAAAAGTTTPDHSYAFQYKLTKTELCDPAQKAKDAGDSDNCTLTLNDSASLAPSAFTYSNIEDACKVASQPKAKSALVDTNSAIANNIPLYDPSATTTKPSAYRLAS